jgi:hypothetical protein
MTTKEKNKVVKEGPTATTKTKIVAQVADRTTETTTAKITIETSKIEIKSQTIGARQYEETAEEGREGKYLQTSPPR